MAEKKTTLCWSCIHAVPNKKLNHGCNWSKNYIPVDDWVAKPTIIASNNMAQSYMVVLCPEYVREVRK